MTHSTIYEKFMIEYDKDTVTSSYPSLTKKEQATILNKAYLALIAQKITGNNIRRSGLETDLKSISDLQPLMIQSNRIDLTSVGMSINDKYGSLPISPKFLYFVSGYVDEGNAITPVNLVNHNTAQKFLATSYNTPWVKIPVCYIQDDKIHVVFDPMKYVSGINNIYITYIKQPAEFSTSSDNTTFELNDSMAEELVSLAVIFALENVESQRLNSKLNTRGLEV